jgi:hypothetical protein
MLAGIYANHHNHHGPINVLVFAVGVSCFAVLLIYILREYENRKI